METYIRALSHRSIGDSAGGSALAYSAERAANAPERYREILHDELSVQVEHAVAKCFQPGIPTRVRADVACVVKSVNFHHELRSGSEEVYDGLPENDLPSE